MGPVDAFERSPEAVTRDMVERAAGRVPGSCGASSEIWFAGVLSARVCSHPDLGQLMAAEPGLPDSPMRAAARTRQPSRIADTLRDVLWRPFSARALEIGVRSLVCVARAIGDREVMTCTVYALRPDGLPEQAASLADLLLTEWTTAQAHASAFAEVQAEAHHLTEAIAARELVEQAKGMLMHALNCDADTAFRELETAAARSGLRITDVAQRMVAHRAATPGAPKRHRSRRAGPVRDQQPG